MTHAQVTAVIYFVAMLLAAGFAVTGWLLPLNDGARRFTFRYLGCGLAAAAFAVTADNSHGWFAVYWWAFSIYLFWRAIDWYRASQRMRVVEAIHRKARAARRKINGES